MSSTLPNAKNDDQGNYYVVDQENKNDDKISPLVVGSHNFTQSPQYQYFLRKIDTKRRAADPCGDGTLGEINIAIQKLFIALKGVQKYKSTYVDGAINKVANLRATISKLTSTIASVLKGLVQRIRNFVLNKIKDLVLQALSYIMTNFLKQIKDSIIAAVIDQIFCAFEKIVAGLFAMVADFLYSFIGQVVNAPICAVEQWTNALVNKLINDIDSALDPIFGQINDLLGGVAKVTGSVSSAIDTILGFQGFLCNAPKCPELKEFAASPWGGPSDQAAQDFASFTFDSGFIDQGAKQANQWLDDFFGPDGNSSQSPGSCYTGLFECGLPQVKIFGGQGSGAVAQAIVNDIGQVIGTNVLSGGKDYDEAPFVSFVDPAGCGSNASGYAEVEDGKVKDVVIINPGGDYSKNNNGGSPVINKFIASPNPIKVNTTVTVEWDTSNADNVKLIDFPNYSDLPSSGTISFPFTEDLVTFDPEADFTTYTLRLRATKQNSQSESQLVEQKFILTVTKNDSEEGLNVKSPVIDKFKASPSNVKVGDVVDISWKTSNAQYVKIHRKLQDLETGKLPANNSTLSVVAPDVEIPTGGSVTEVYTLTAFNEDAAGPPFEVEEKVSVTISNADPEDEDIFDDDDDDDTKDPIVPDEDEEDEDTPGDGDDDDDDEDEDADDDDDGDDDTVIIDDDDDDDDEDDDDEDDEEDDDDDDDDASDGTTPGITIIDSVDVINTGIGYTFGDTVVLDNVGAGTTAVLDLDINDLGQIVDVVIRDGGFGYTRIPDLSINSGTGLGVQLRTRLKFVPLDDFLSDRDLARKEIGLDKLVRVIDCIS
tara:strand:+ start:2417 stop:4882 length:2466 start_codon:yes stop_codon:yes gene_type:complete